MNIHEVHNEFIVKKHKQGIKLLKPTCPLPQEGQTVANLLQLPINIIFLNTHSETKNINENNAATLGCDSIHTMINKNIHTVYKKNAAEFSINHDQQVINNNQMIIKEEDCQRIDEVSFQAITAKLPWYGEDDAIKGVMGCSIPIGLHSHQLQPLLSTFIQLTLCNNHHFLNNIFSNNMKKTFYLSQRERECIYHLVHGKTAKMIGQALHLSYRTVEHHIEGIKVKLQVHSKAELIDKALQLKLWQ